MSLLDIGIEEASKELERSLYRKLTQTGQYLDFQSNHRINLKEGKIRTVGSS